MPVRSVGPLTTRGAVSAGLRVLSNVCTTSNSATSMISGDHLSLGLPFARFPIFGVEAMAADIRRSGEYLVHGIDAPASAVTRSNARFIQMLGDRFDAHRPRGAVSLAREAEDQPHGLGLDGIDLQRLLGTVAAFLRGFHDAVADRRQQRM